MSVAIEHMRSYEHAGVQLAVLNITDRDGENPIRLWIRSYDTGEVSVATEEGGDVIWPGGVEGVPLPHLPGVA